MFAHWLTFSFSTQIVLFLGKKLINRLLKKKSKSMLEYKQFLNNNHHQHMHTYTNTESRSLRSFLKLAMEPLLMQDTGRGKRHAKKFWWSELPIIMTASIRIASWFFWFMVHAILACFYFLGINGIEHNSLQAFTCHAYKFQTRQFRVRRQPPVLYAVFNSNFVRLDIKYVHSTLCLHNVVIFKLEHPSIMEKRFSLKDGIHFSYIVESYN